PAETKHAALADLNRGPVQRQSAADSELLELLGLVPAGTDLRKIEGAVSGQEVIGFYDTRSKKLAIVNGPALSDAVTTGVTLAHELDHALDDQRFGIRDASGAGTDDQATAYTALIEGVATRVMDEYARRYVNPVEAFGSGLSQLGAAGA